MDRSFVIDRRSGMWLGVCQGLADYSGAPAALVRAGAVLLTLAGLGLPGVLAYLAIGLIAGKR